MIRLPPNGQRHPSPATPGTRWVTLTPVTLDYLPQQRGAQSRIVLRGTRLLSLGSGLSATSIDALDYRFETPDGFQGTLRNVIPTGIPPGVLAPDR